MSEIIFTNEKKISSLRDISLDKNKRNLNYSPTYFTDLDKILGGFEKSSLIILGSRPSIGKTSLALSIAKNILFKSNKPVAFFSLEMSAQQAFDRMLSFTSKVEIHKIKTVCLNTEECKLILDCIDEIEKHNFLIEACNNISIENLCSKAIKLKKEFDIGFLVVDSFQLLSSSRQENKCIEMFDIASSLKSLAMELDIPILCTSQVSKKVEERSSHRPLLSELHDYGALEGIADIIIFLIRRDYYDPLDKPGMAELHIAKNRHGNIGHVSMTFRKEFAQFTNYTPINYDEQNESGIEINLTRK